MKVNPQQRGEGPRQPCLVQRTPGKGGTGRPGDHTARGWQGWALYLGQHELPSPHPSLSPPRRLLKKNKTVSQVLGV